MDEASGLGMAPGKLLEELQKLRSLDVPLSTGKKTLLLRMAVTASREQVLLQGMKILIPNRPKRIENVVEKMA